MRHKYNETSQLFTLKEIKKYLTTSLPSYKKVDEVFGGIVHTNYPVLYEF